MFKAGRKFGNVIYNLPMKRNADAALSFHLFLDKEKLLFAFFFCLLFFVYVRGQQDTNPFKVKIIYMGSEEGFSNNILKKNFLRSYIFQLALHV